MKEKILLITLLLVSLEICSQSFFSSITIDPKYEYEEFEFNISENETINIRYNSKTIEVVKGDTTYNMDYIDTLQFILGYSNDSTQYFKYKNGKNGLSSITSNVICNSYLPEITSDDYMFCKISKKNRNVEFIECENFKQYWYNAITNISDCNLKYDHQTIDSIKNRAYIFLDNCSNLRPQLTVEYLFERYIIPKNDKINILTLEEINDIKIQANIIASHVEPIYGGKRISYFYADRHISISGVTTLTFRNTNSDGQIPYEVHVIEFDRNGLFLDKEIIRNATSSTRNTFILEKFTRI